ncbi:MAG TPA: OpgC domain-containing protein [Pseudolabrys sp.]|nr:OpgC domain-containing protein [Pseudolabrys sp.]
MTDHSSGAVKVPAFRIDGDRRDLRLDAFRGLALCFIFLDHIPDNVLAWLTLRNYGFSDTTEVFVFVSGYTCMLAYGGALRGQGWPTTVTRAQRRGWEIYVAFLLLLIAYLAVIWAVGGGSRYLDETDTAIFFQNPGAAIIHAALMQYTPVNTDILPTFVLLHLGFPGLLWLLTRNAAVALAASLLLYLLVQAFGWNLPAWPQGGWFFNPLAWQALFVFGAWYVYEGADRLRTIVQSRAALLLAMLYLAFSLAVALSWQFKALEGFMPDALSKLIYPIDKSNLSPLRLLHFLALAIVVVRLTSRQWRGLMKLWMRAMIRCGENSLAMYCFGVLLSFMGHAVLVEFSGTIAMQIAVSIAGIALMIAAATLMTWTSQLDRHGPKLF